VYKNQYFTTAWNYRHHAVLQAESFVLELADVYIANMDRKLTAEETLKGRKWRDTVQKANRARMQVYKKEAPETLEICLDFEPFTKLWK
jgi:hypothetical protein